MMSKFDQRSTLPSASAYEFAPSGFALQSGFALRYVITFLLLWLPLLVPANSFGQFAPQPPVQTSAQPYAPIQGPGQRPTQGVNFGSGMHGGTNPDMTATAFDPHAFHTNQTVRIKDITLINGDRNNHTSGNGLVFGLSGTGGKSEQTRSMASAYFLRKGIRINNVDTKNMSAVLVSAKIPPYARKGETILVNVAVADDAKSLRGGYLNQTVLRGLDDEIYAIAQGPIVGGGISAGGNAASVQLNHPTGGVCEAIIEREICSDQIMKNGRIRLVLQNKEYSTATQIANVLNGVFPRSSRALDSGTVEALVPRSFHRSLPAFISMIGELRVQPDMKARVVINQKTGTILMGRNVRISKVLFASENVVISTQETPIAVQPAPLSNGVTAILPRTNVDIFASGGNYNIWNEGITVGELAHALNTLAMPPNALINIFTSLRNQGALQAELIIE